MLGVGRMIVLLCISIILCFCWMCKLQNEINTLSKENDLIIELVFQCVNILWKEKLKEYKELKDNEF